MFCLLSGHDYYYDIQTIAQIFFPNERFIRVDSPETNGLTAVSVLKPDNCIGALYINGVLKQECAMPIMPRHCGLDPQSPDISDMYGIPGQARDDCYCDAATRVPVTGRVQGSQEIRRRLMLSLFLALKAYTGLNPPWGALTGIRPSKMARLLMEQGLTKDGLTDAMERYYLARRDKITLASDVAAAEKDILDAQPADAFCLYIGIPFCPSRCLYCSFASYPLGKNVGLINSYLDALEKELYTISALTSGQSLSAVYVGGGTPTALSEQQLDRLLTLINRLFGAAGEYSVEAGRPDTLDTGKLRILKSRGVNRLSINPQSLHDDTLARIGRSHSAEDFYKAFALARAEGFDNINADIILGLPGEDPRLVEETTRRLLALKPENVTVHILTIKRASLLRETLEKYPMTGAAELEAMLDISRGLCVGAGMKPYYMYRQKNMLGNFENVGYSLPGRESLYNALIMEETRPIWAAGAGAVTKLVFGDRIERVFNVKNVEAYISRIDEMIKRKEDNHADPAPPRH